MGIPCDVQVALDNGCLRCHGENLEFDAPYGFTDWSVFHETRGDFPVHVIIRASIEEDYMPPLGITADPPVTPLSTADETTLLNWLDREAPAEARDACE